MTPTSTAILVAIDSPVGWGEGKTQTYEHRVARQSKPTTKTALDLPDLAAGLSETDLICQHPSEVWEGQLAQEAQELQSPAYEG